jgi:hypothetical protein
MLPARLNRGRALLGRVGSVHHLIAAIGQFVDFRLQLVSARLAAALQSGGFANVELPQSHVHVEEQRAFLRREHFQPPMRSALNLGLQPSVQVVPLANSGAGPRAWPAEHIVKQS